MAKKCSSTDRINIAESRRILGEATEGPWTIEGYRDLLGAGGFTLIGANGLFYEAEDAQAAAHAINTLPLALDEIERLRAEVERLRESIKGLARVCDGEPVKARRSLDFWAGVDYGNRNTASALRACLTPDRAALTPDRAALTPEDSDER